eukprot:scaffold13439_cov105-Skeletonema_dohrnii-CCMP3373.AAC.3
MAQGGVSRRRRSASRAASVFVHCIQVHFVLARTCVLAPSVLKNQKSARTDDAITAPPSRSGTSSSPFSFKMGMPCPSVIFYRNKEWTMWLTAAEPLPN